MKRLMLLAVAVLFAFVSCGDPLHKPSVNMDGRKANCEYPVLTFKMADGSTREVNLNGLPVRTFYGAELVCQPCANPGNWRLVTRRGVAMADVFAAAGITAVNHTPINMVGRDGFDVLRMKLSGDTDKIPNFGYINAFAYVYVGAPGFKDPANPSVETAKDPLYPDMEGKSLCIDYNHETIIGAADQAGAMGVDTTGCDACFGAFRMSMLEKFDETHCGVIEIDPQ